MNEFKLWTSSALFILMLLLGSCRQDHIDVDLKENPDISKTVEMLIVGKIMDLNGQTIEGALIHLLDINSFSEQGGLFHISGQAPSTNAFLKVTMPGYFDSFASFNAELGGSVSVEIRMIPIGQTRIISGTTGGIFSTIEGASVEFAPNSFRKNGLLYQGKVSLNMAYLDPTIANIESIMPGDLSAIDQEGEDKLLTSFGMLKVEIKDASGNDLDLTFSAKLNIPVPSSLMSQANATIPMWYFDEVNGKWREDGFATLEGDVYKSEVYHFTFWNCDIPNDYIELNGRVLVKDKGVSIVVCVRNTVTNVKRCDYSNADGYFSGKVPSGVDLELTVLGGCDGEIVESLQLGELTVDTKLADIVLNSQPLNGQIHIFGSAVDCDGDKVINGFVDVGLVAGGPTGNETKTERILVIDGDFSKYIDCDYDYSVLYTRVVNLDSPSDNLDCAKSLFIKSRGKEIDLGVLKACYGAFEVKMTWKDENGNLIPEAPLRFSMSNKSTNTKEDITITLEALEYFIDVSKNAPGQQPQYLISMRYTGDPSTLKYFWELDGGDVVFHELTQSDDSYERQCTPLIVELKNIRLFNKNGPEDYPNCNLYFKGITR